MRQMLVSLRPRGLRGKLVLATASGAVVIFAAAFLRFSPVNPGIRELGLWTPAEIGIAFGVFAAVATWAFRTWASDVSRRMVEVERLDAQRRNVVAMGVAANWDLDIGRVYKRVAQDLRSLVDHDRLVVTSAQPDGRMRVEFVEGDVDEGCRPGELFAPGNSAPDGLDPEYEDRYKSRLTVPFASSNGTFTLRSREPERYSAEQFEVMRQVVAHIAPGVSNAMMYQSTERQSSERAALAEIGRAATTETELEPLFAGVQASLSKLVPFDHIGIILIERATSTGTLVHWSWEGLAGWSSGMTVQIADGVLAQDGVTTLDEIPIGAATGSPDPDRGRRVWLQAPLVVRDSLIGLLVLSSSDLTALGDQEAALLQSVSRQIAPAIQNATMLAEERKLRQRLDEQNRELQEAHNSRKQFLSTVSHELKTPLTIISGFIDLLTADRDSNLSGEQKETLDIVRRNADRLDVLINDILDISRIDAGTFNLNITDFSVGQLAHELKAGFEPILAQKSQSLHITEPGADVWLSADRTRIAQLITNLVTNGSKYSPDGSQVEVDITTLDGKLFVNITDHGIGISKEDQEGLFTAFYRVDNESTRQVAGTGLGLLIARSIAELHGGSLELESAEGKGTSVRFWLPGVITADEAAEREDAAASGFTGSRLWDEDEMDELELGAD